MADPTNAPNDALEAHALSKTYHLPPPPGRSGSLTVKAVRDVSLTLKPGRTMALVGESGCGKSTIAKMLSGLEPPTEGEITLDGKDLAKPSARLSAWRKGRRIQMIFQDPYASLNPRWTVAKILQEALKASGTVSRRDMREATLAALSAVGLPGNAAAKFPHEFSGGQRQRISIARALACEPQFLICDEPTSALDVSVQAQILNVLKDVQAERGLAFLLITHDLSVVHHMADHVGVMYLGQLVEDREAGDLFAAPAHPYTRMLLDTIPRADRPGRRPAVMSGEVPNPISPPTGCPFNPRCSFANDRCRAERPVPTPVSGGHVACHAIEEGRLA
ncbi:ATP-binding cassette domain-containing protein [Martelella mediterranea]|uniref:ABC transporter ATP-binding protein n=1 Tax=Martelella mediterranea TaxID=293089 RepID=UPI001E5C332B|nr:oligopeptide/dipeptide ABC transporter ATP-binding protein [Martelella mediterranea]MCD1632544.1 ATP-binding cassette domain-containing protein [Martelella mediterranea]